MKFTAILSAAILGASTALALPTDLPEGVTLVPRAPRQNVRRSGLKKPVPASDVSIEGLTNNSNVEYSSNWAGAVLIGSGYKSVTGSIVVPTPKVPSGGSSSKQYAASAWVGIDGDTCDTAILQTGVDFYVKGSTVSFDAWYEWYPDYAYTFSGFSISAGDTITMTATATSTSAGSVTIKNVTKGKTVTHSFSSETNKLCETNAEWIVEDFESNGALVPFANFGTVTFTGASVSTSSGTVGVSGATIIDIQQSSTVLTSCSTSGSSSVGCSYV
ncbi:peptidase A4 family-domain-containing protein [Bombardia bombarda]|uniref:Peptidase A4 family-domain-containing protein n=1 Tax=Bombardia bombarda TaxID=252184 RepID=A0AA40BVZ3_9PEZI|nr:peptidase A4 family-domain-containing protein [Bombardia bombarda]